MKICCKRNRSADSEEKAEDSKKGTDLVADRDCTIVSIVTRNGIPAVKAGSKVKKGDILVSGRVEMKNDSRRSDRLPLQRSRRRY